MEKQFKIEKVDVEYNGFFRLEKYHLQHTLFAGGWSPVLQRELFRRSNCVGVLLYDPDLDEIVLIEQFRVGAVLQPENAWLLEIVAGGIEEGETAEQVAYRESVEEAGCEIQELMLINEFYTSPGACSEWLTLFCAKVDASNVTGIHGLDHEHEDIRVSSVKFNHAYQLLEQGEICSGIPIIAIQWLALNHEKVRQKWAKA